MSKAQFTITDLSKIPSMDTLTYATGNQVTVKREDTTKQKINNKFPIKNTSVEEFAGGYTVITSDKPPYLIEIEAPDAVIDTLKKAKGFIFVKEIIDK